MDTPSNPRLLGMCLIAAVTGFVVWFLALPDTSGVLILGIAIVVLAMLMFVDGYVSVT